MTDIRDLPALTQPPSSTEAEVSLLGAILFDNLTLERCAGLSASDFFITANQRIFSIIERIIRAGGNVDGVILRDRLRNDGGLDEVGGMAYLTTLMECAAPLTSQALSYAEMLRELSMRRTLLSAGQKAISLAMKPPEGDDAFTLYSSVQHELDSVANDAAAPLLSMGEAIGRFTQALDRPQSRAIPSNYDTLDKRWGGGFHRGDLIVMAGRPSMGKTALAFNAARNQARANNKIGVFSAEMSAEALAMRALAAASYRQTNTSFERVAYTHLRNGAPGVDRDRLKAWGATYADMPLLIDDRAGLNVQQIEWSARAMRRQLGGLDVIYIDYLQILARPSSRGRNDAAVLGEMTTALKTLARSLKIAVVLLSQLSRAVEARDDKRPMLSDLRESGSIEQDADVVIGIFREGYYLERSKPPETAGSEKVLEWQQRYERAQDVIEIATLKQRNGPVGSDVLKTLLQYDVVLNIRV